MAHDWEMDPRNFADCLRTWTEQHGWSGAEAARQLRAPYQTYNNWLAERRSPSPEPLVRRLMTLIDAQK